MELKTTPDAMAHYKDAKNVKLFTEMGVYTEQEMEAHYETKLEKYSQILNIEVETMLEMINKDILPAAYSYVSAVAKTVAELKAVVPSAKAAAETTLLSKLDALTGDLAAKAEELSKVHLAAKGAGDCMAVAKAYADKKVADLVGGASASLDTLQELAAALGNDANFSTTVLNKIGEKANTADVNAALDGKAPLNHGTHVTYATVAGKAPGTAAVGTSSKVAREDHVHPLQTTISGNAGSATKLTSNGGSSIQPVYFSDGKPVACGFTVESVTEEEIAGIFTT